jgi:hypothetical protein
MVETYLAAIAGTLSVNKLHFFDSTNIAGHDIRATFINKMKNPLQQNGSMNYILL